MAIRLLPKQEISVLQASKKRVEIDEGLKLARRIDSLREIAASEEASLASFRDSTLKAISEDIKKIEEERSVVLNEVKSLRDEINTGTKVLDERENDLKQLEIQLNERENVLLVHLGLLKIAAEELKKQSKITLSYHQKIVSALTLIEEVRKQTAATYIQAEQYLAQVMQSLERTDLLVETVTDELKTRDITVASKERDLIIKEEHLDTKAKSLRIKELQLIDREQTLERAFNRLKK